jgi:hypothetical protein
LYPPEREGRAPPSPLVGEGDSMPAGVERGEGSQPLDMPIPLTSLGFQPSRPLPQGERRARR